MAHLTLRHAQRLSAALTPLYAAPLATDPANAPGPAALIGRLSAAVSELLGAELTCFDCFDARGQMLTLGDNAPSLFTPTALAYLAQHIQQHPLFAGIYVRRSPSPLKITDFCPSGAFFRTDIFNDFYRPIAITHQLIVGFEVPGQGYTTCALSRTRRDFTETDRALLAFVQPHLAALLRPATPAPLPAPDPDAAARRSSQAGLTRRETLILEQASQGQPDKIIAERCGISPRTVHNHLRNIYAKLGVANRTAAARRVFGPAAD